MVTIAKEVYESRARTKKLARNKSGSTRESLSARVRQLVKRISRHSTSRLYKAISARHIASMNSLKQYLRITHAK